MSGGKGGGSVTVGYWYKLLLHFGLCRGPIDAFLEFRGGDRTAWQGEMTASGSITIDQPGLWGGESSEGGIQGTCEVMFGDAAQQPNTYLASAQGVDQSAYRGKATVVYRGRYGAGNPYPKPAAFLIRRIKKGWDNDACWYPEKADVLIGAEGVVPTLYRSFFGPSGGEELSTHWEKDIASFFIGSRGSGTRHPEKFTIRTQSASDVVSLHVPDPQTPYNGSISDARPGWSSDVGTTWQCTVHIRTLAGTTDYFPGTFGTPEEALAAAKVLSPIKLTGSTQYEIWISHFLPEQEMEDIDAYRGGLTLGVPVGTLVAMNPAHILYDSLTQSDMMGEPVGLINEASFHAAADTLFAEEFGLCTTYDATSESITDFQKRICNVIGASLSRSRVNGQWYLDLLRANYTVADLPILTDDDILEWSAQPGTLDSAVNQVTVEWFDPVKKETRTTAPCQALGLIQAFGGIKSDSSSYPEIPGETLALRCAARDLRNKATPVTRFELKTTRTPHAWRPGTCFRLQAPKRGIADMVCRVGEIDTGTIRQGAIALTAVQDVFGLPATVYVQPESGINTNAPRTPVAAPAQRAIEAPYTELVQRLSQADRDYLAADAGYLLMLAAQPAQSLNYALATAASGEDYAQRGSGDWCPTALITSASGYLDTVFSFTSGCLLDRVTVGSAALWNDEIVRVELLDTVAGSVTLARGCADTVPAKHAAGSRIWFYDAAAASDYREYATGETVSTKCLTRTGGALLPLASAPASMVVMDARWIRPYPPANVTFNGETDPATLRGQIVLVWAQRNRITQADKLIDTTAASLTPEVGTTYAARLLRADNSNVLDSLTGITGTTATLSAAYSGQVVVELWSERDGYTSLQSVRRTVAYTPGEFTRITEDGETRITESGDVRITE